MNQSVWRRVTEVAALTMACALIPVGIASAGTPAHQQDGDSSESSADGSYIESVERINGRQQIVNVYAASMDRTVPIQVITPADNSVPRPILYLLNGAGGGEDSATWEYQTDVVDFFQDKNVNVVTPVGGRLSYYTDWEKEDPKLGKNMWSTFLARNSHRCSTNNSAATGTNLWQRSRCQVPQFSIWPSSTQVSTSRLRRTAAVRKPAIPSDSSSSGLPLSGSAGLMTSRTCGSVRQRRLART